MPIQFSGTIFHLQKDFSQNRSLTEKVDAAIKKYESEQDYDIALTGSLADPRMNDEHLALYYTGPTVSTQDKAFFQYMENKFKDEPSIMFLPPMAKAQADLFERQLMTSSSGKASELFCKKKLELLA